MTCIYKALEIWWKKCEQQFDFPSKSNSHSIYYMVGAILKKGQPGMNGLDKVIEHLNHAHLDALLNPPTNDMNVSYQENTLSKGCVAGLARYGGIGCGVDFNVFGNLAELVGKLEADADIAVFVNLDVVDLIAQHIRIPLLFPARDGFVLGLGEQELRIGGHVVALIAGDQLPALGLVRVLPVFKTVFQRLGDGFPLADMVGDQACCGRKLTSSRQTKRGRRENPTARYFWTKCPEVIS